MSTNRAMGAGTKEYGWEIGQREPVTMGADAKGKPSEIWRGKDKKELKGEIPIKGMHRCSNSVHLQMRPMRVTLLQVDRLSYLQKMGSSIVWACTLRLYSGLTC